MHVIKIPINKSDKLQKARIRLIDWILRPMWAYKENRKCDHDWQDIDDLLTEAEYREFIEFIKEYGIPQIPGMGIPDEVPLAGFFEQFLIGKIIETRSGDRVCLRCKTIDRRFTEYVRGAMSQFAIDTAIHEKREMQAKNILEKEQK